MSTPFLAEIKLMAFGYPPKGWAQCFGQFLPINQNQALFALLGTTFGGNGQTTFALPNFQARIPIHMGNGHILGEAAGSQSVTLTQGSMPAHTHFVNADTTPNSNAPTSSSYLANSSPPNLWGPRPDNSMDPAMIGNTGGSQAHENRMPFLVLNFSIALVGIFPSPN
jgi:microcystin-dependent protein